MGILSKNSFLIVPQRGVVDKPPLSKDENQGLSGLFYTHIKLLLMQTGVS